MCVCVRERERERGRVHLMNTLSEQLFHRSWVKDLLAFPQNAEKVTHNVLDK